MLVKKVGDYVAEGETIAFIHANDLTKVKECTTKLLEAYSFTSEKPEPRPLIFGMVDKNGIKKYF